MRIFKYIVLSLAVAAYAGMYASQNNPPVQSPVPPPGQPMPVTQSPQQQVQRHNGFFFAAEIGARYMKVSYKEYEDYWDEKSQMWIVGDDGNSVSRRFRGYGPDLGLKIGGIISSRVALFCNLEFSALDGNFKGSHTYNGKKQSKADFDTDAIRFAFGGGALVFLNSDSMSFLNGVFVGATASITAEEAGLSSGYYNHEELEISESGLAFGLQFGKVWSISDSWNVGFAAKGSLENGIRDGSSGNASDSYAIAVDLIVLRK